VDRDDRRIGEPRDRPGLLLEPRARDVVVLLGTRQHLQRDLAAEPGIARLEHEAHATAPEQADQLEPRGQPDRARDLA
jgi:hypothetical protein